eukprot:764116-Hanusia_phi.AAC.5
MENSFVDDYVTEKFYQALIAGSVPVYLGAPNIHEFAPSPNSFIDMRRCSTFLNVQVRDSDDRVERLSGSRRSRSLPITSDTWTATFLPTRSIMLGGGEEKSQGFFLGHAMPRIPLPQSFRQQAALGFNQGDFYGEKVKNVPL